ncbi:MAG: hypothetical protein M1836_002609 [Candelina mexicana]|nr:MAG: hypothetical protein M1836_002609 [Candelina mexicana]
MLSIVLQIRAAQPTQIARDGLLVEKVVRLWHMGKEVRILAGLEKVLKLLQEGEREDEDDFDNDFDEEEVYLAEEIDEDEKDDADDIISEEEECLSGLDSCGAPKPETYSSCPMRGQY